MATSSPPAPARDSLRCDWTSLRQAESSVYNPPGSAVRIGNTWRRMRRGGGGFSNRLPRRRYWPRSRRRRSHATVSSHRRFFPYDILTWRTHYWWINRRPPVYSLLFQGAKANRFQLHPDTAVDCAFRLSETIDGQWLRDLCRPFVSRWSAMRLVTAARGSVIGPRAAVSEVLKRIELRKNKAGRAFEQLYYRRSGGLWKR
jgi:hypothetical protein